MRNPLKPTLVFGRSNNLSQAAIPERPYHRSGGCQRLAVIVTDSIRPGVLTTAVMRIS